MIKRGKALINVMTLFHEGGTKFYETIIITRFDGLATFYINRYGKNSSFMDGGGQMDFKTINSNDLLTSGSHWVGLMEATNKLSSKYKRGYKDTTAPGNVDADAVNADESFHHAVVRWAKETKKSDLDENYAGTFNHEMGAVHPDLRGVSSPCSVVDVDELETVMKMTFGAETSRQMMDVISSEAEVAYTPKFDPTIERGGDWGGW